MEGVINSMTGTLTGPSESMSLVRMEKIRPDEAPGIYLF
jgi:hypothetical protein